MSRIFSTRFATLATALTLASVAALTLTAQATARPIIPAVNQLPTASTTAPTAAAAGSATASKHAAASTPSPLRTPTPEPGLVPWAMSTSSNLLPIGAILLVGIAVLAVAALLIGVYLMIAWRPGSAHRVHEQRPSAGRVAQSPSAGGLARRAA
jgi:hypothetical protein